MKTSVAVERPLFPPRLLPPDRRLLGKGFVLAVEGELLVVFRGEVPLYHCRSDDSAGRYWVMADLVRHHGLKVLPVASAFAIHRATLHEMLHRFDEEGYKGLFARDRHPTPSKIGDAVASQLLELKRRGASHSEAARRLGVTEGGVRKALKRLGWTDPTTKQEALPLAPPAHQADEVSGAADAACTPSFPPPPTSASQPAPERNSDAAHPDPEQASVTLDVDPLNRQADRLFARLGMLDDAAPLFAPGVVPRGGVLLAVPALIASGVFDVAPKVYGSIGPAFYGLRTSILGLLLMALLRIKRPEHLKEVSPPDLGRVLGLDRAPEMKTLRGKLKQLAAQGKGLEFMRLLAHIRANEHANDLAYLYIDGHVRVYNGQKRISKAYVMQRRLAMPGTTDYWVNDQRGQPLLVITAEANEGLSKMLPPVLAEVRGVIGDQRVTVAFDRGGWNTKLFKVMVKDGNWDILTYRKGSTQRVSRKSFGPHTIQIDGREGRHELSEKNVRIGGLKLRQITVLGKHNHQTHIVTSKEDVPAIEIAYRMFERWGQENYFKYMKEEFALDALVEYGVEAAEPTRMVPNPERKAIDKELAAAKADLAKLEREFGAAAFANKEDQRRTMRGFKIANGGSIGKPLREALDKVRTIEERRKSIPTRVTVTEALKDSPVRLRTETKRLSDTFKMVAYQSETALLDLLRPHYRRTEDEGRTLIATALQSAAELELRDGELRVTLAAQSSPHRTRAIAGLCEELNKIGANFPGTRLRLRYEVAGAEVSP